MKTLKFKNDLVAEILTGRKTSTWRLFDDKDLQVGDELELINKDTLEKFAEAKIIEVSEKKIKDLKEKDAVGHGNFEEPNVMLEKFRYYYGDKVDLNTAVMIIRFQLKKYE